MDILTGGRNLELFKKTFQPVVSPQPGLNSSPLLGASVISQVSVPHLYINSTNPS